MQEHWFDCRCSSGQNRTAASEDPSEQSPMARKKLFARSLHRCGTEQPRQAGAAAELEIHFRWRVAFVLD
jgi:hypothetical protein